MQDNKFLPKLSQNLLELLDNDNEYYDITIEVGDDPYVKIFRAHMNILNYRSPYLRRILSANEKKNDGTLTHIKLSNILPKIFQKILRYIYGGRISLEEFDDTSDIFKILIAAGELGLQELIDYLQSSLIESKTTWMEQNFDLIYQTSFKDASFLELQKYCAEIISREPDKIFKSLDFSLIPENLLISLVQNDNIQMSEIQVWEHVVKWGLAQHPELSSDPTSYSKDDFNVLKNTLQQCIPFIRFYNLTSKEFLDKVLPYKKALPKELYKELIKHFLDQNPSSREQPKFRSSKVAKEINSGIRTVKETEDAIVRSEPKEAKDKSGIQMTKEVKEIPSESQMIKETKVELASQVTEDARSEPQMTKEIKGEMMSSDIDSRIISNQHVGLISRWIIGIDVPHISMLSNWKPSYKFKLLFRGSRDGFTSSNFHKICDYQPSTVIIIKLKDSNEILGGYNPIEWRSDNHYGTTKDSFIFSFKGKDRIDDFILSRVIDKHHAIYNESYCGPSFGKEDLILEKFSLSKSYFYCKSKKSSYEKPIRQTEVASFVEEYEVFRIVKITS